MAPTPVRFVPESPGIAPQTVTQESQRRPISRYAGRGRSSRSLRGLETRGTASCCIRSKSSRFVIHAFREGNTRSQFVFFTKLTRAAGFDVNPHMYGPGQPLRQQFVDARFYHQATGDASRLRAALAPAVTIPSPGSRPDRSLRDRLHRALSEEPPAAAPVYRRGEDPDPPTAHHPSIEGE